MPHLGDFRIDDYITFGVQLHRFSSGAVYAPTGTPTYTFYENNSTTGAPTGGNLAQLNSKTGLYTARVQLTTAAGFEAGKDYFVHCEATVDSVAAAELYSFRVIAPPTVDVVSISGDTTAADNCELMFDGTGYAGGTAKLGVDVVAISGDATSADNLELYTDGTTPAPVNVTQIGGVVQSLTDLKDFVDTGYDPTTHKVVGVVTTDVLTTYTGNTLQTGNVATLITTVGVAGAGLTDLGGMSTGMKAQVNAEVLDVMDVDTYAEPPQGSPSDTLSIFAKLNYLFKWTRNQKWQTSTTKSFYNSAGTVVDHKCTVSDDATTYKETVIVSGP